MPVGELGANQQTRQDDPPATGAAHVALPFGWNPRVIESTASPRHGDTAGTILATSGTDDRRGGRQQHHPRSRRPPRAWPSHYSLRFHRGTACTRRCKSLGSVSTALSLVPPYTSPARTVPSASSRSRLAPSTSSSRHITPFTLFSLRGPGGWILFAFVWTLAAIGIVFKSFAPDASPSSTAVY